MSAGRPATVAAAEVERLVPHREAMLWLARVVHVDDDGLAGWVGIEYMAQTIAAWAGARALARGEPARPGFLLGTRRYRCRRPWLEWGLRLRIEARREMMGDNGLGMFACRLLAGDEEIATANVSEFEPPDPAAFLEDVSP